MKKLLFPLLLILFLNSCSQYEGDYISTQEEKSFLDLDETRIKFAQILSLSLENKSIRDFIKEEALKKIDNDYDVIYHNIKNNTLKNGETFQEALSKYCDIDYLNKITSQDPLLTIFIPQLNDIFSAESWNTNEQVPYITIRNTSPNDSLTIIKHNEISKVSRNLYPKEAVIVIKTNERLTTSNNMQSKSATNDYLFSEDNISIHFLDNSFNNTKDLTQTRESNPIIESLDLNRAKAFFLNNESSRDYLYYNISPKTNINSGILNHRYREYLTSLSFNSANIFDHVSDKSDPTGDWTDGDLEIKVDFMLIDNQGNATTFTKMISINTSDLFIINNNNKITGVKKYYLQKPIDLFEWDFYKFGNMFKIAASEYDPGNEIETTYDFTSTFGTNFESSSEWTNGDLKQGNKYSNSSTYTQHSSVKVKSTNNSDPLGDVLVNFFDPIYIHMDHISISFNDKNNNYSDVLEYSINDYEKFNTDYENCISSSGIELYEASRNLTYDTGMLTLEIKTLKNR